MKNCITICDNCPCLNLDIENPAECNLKFTTNLGWHKIGDRSHIVEDTEEMRAKQNEHDLIHYSYDCKLKQIHTEDLSFSPERY